MSQNSNLDTIFKALDKANRAGVFTLNESAAIYSAFGNLAEELNSNGISSKGREDEEGGHTPIPPIGPKG